MTVQRRRALMLLSLWLVLSGAACATARRASPPGPRPATRLIGGAGTVVLRGATLIDGTGAGPRRDAVVAIANGRIDFVGSGTGGVQFGPEVQVVDLTGRWITPGFVDVHAHVPRADRPETPAFLAQLLAFGTTTLRDPANGNTLLRDRVAGGAVLGPRILVAGNLIDGKDSFMGGERVGTEEEIREVVRRQADQGVDFVKLYVGLQPNLVRAAIEAAHRRGLRVVGHLGRTTWADAAEMGIDTLAHSWYAGLAHSIVPAQHREEFRDFYIPNRRFDAALFARWRVVVADPDGPEVARLASLLHERRVTVHPNLVLGESIAWGDDAAVLERLRPDLAGAELAATWRQGRHPYSAGWSAEAMSEAKLAFPIMVRVIRAFHDRGVILTAGTDYRNPWMTPGVAFHRELELLASAGISPLDVLQIATRNGAESLGILPETGTIEPGKSADLVVLTADPLAEIANTRKIERVFLRGQPLEPARLLGATTHPGR